MIFCGWIPDAVLIYKCPLRAMVFTLGATIIVCPGKNQKVRLFGIGYLSSDKNVSPFGKISSFFM